MQDIPKYELDKEYLLVHRLPGDQGPFGYNALDPALFIEGFQLFSSQGLASSMGPLRSDFYRIGITLRGTCDVQLGLENFHHHRGTVNCTWPNQIFSKSNISKDLFGYYLLFTVGFLDELIADARLTEEFTFFSYMGTPFFELSPEELDRSTDIILQIDAELQTPRPGREKAIQLNLYLLLLELQRSCIRQEPISQKTAQSEALTLTAKFRRLVGHHYLEKQQVSDYAALLFVTPNHLNRTVKEVSGHTASYLIDEMILQEAKVLLRHTGLSISEIAYKLRFSEPSSFNRFFRKSAGETPLSYRSNA